MNNSVTVSGMQVKTKVGDNLLIAEDTLASVAKKADNLFSNSYAATTLKGYLEPVSSVDAIKFYYSPTDNVKADGDAIDDTKFISYEQYASEVDYGTKASGNANYADLFSENYGVTKTIAQSFYSPTNKALGYIDYAFQLKAINTDGSNAKNINIAELNLMYHGSYGLSDAYRVAVFTQDITSANPTGAAMLVAGNRKGIYTEDGAANFTSGKAVNSNTTLDTVTYVSAATPVAEVPASTTKYFKVIVRLWLEGEDSTCNNETFLALTSDWELDLKLVIEEGTTSAVTNISELSALTASEYTAVADGKITISATDYNVVTGLTYKGNQVYTDSAAGVLTTSSKLFTIAGEVGSEVATEVTSDFKLA